MSRVLQVEIEAEAEKLDEITRGSDYGLFSSRFARRHGSHLLGTAVTWFLVDIAYYSQNLFQKDIFASIHWIPKARTMSAIEEVFRISRGQTLIMWPPEALLARARRRGRGHRERSSPERG